MKEAIVGWRDTAVLCLTSPNCNHSTIRHHTRAYASIREHTCVCMCVCVGEREMRRERGSRGGSGREKERVCVCVCVCIASRLYIYIYIYIYVDIAIERYELLYHCRVAQRAGHMHCIYCM